VIPFAVQVVSSCVSPADLALALAAEYDDALDTDRASGQIDALAAPMSKFRAAPPRAQLEGCAALLARELAPSESLGSLDDLLLHRALDERRAHPVLIAIAGAEAARRAGIPLGVVGGEGELFLAHAGLIDPIGADAHGQTVDLRGREHNLAWRCSHQLAALVLGKIAERAAHTGHVGWALRTAQLRLALPVPDDLRARLEHEYRRVRARLN